MTATIHGELTEDGQTIVLIAAGADPFSGDLELAAKRLQRLTPLINQTDPPGALQLPVSWPAVVQLAQTFGPEWLAGDRLLAWTAAQVAQRTYDVSATPLAYAPPPWLDPLAPEKGPQRLEPRPYQVAGAQLIAITGGGSGLLFDEPGTGKTITTILGLVERAGRGYLPWPVLVVCPASVVDSWTREWRKWAPHLSVVTYRGTPNRRASMAGHQPPAHVYVASYDVARMDAPPGAKPNSKNHKAPLLNLAGGIGARTVVVDEFHLIKNRRAMRSLAVRRLATRAQKLGGNVVGLSGTPITHHPGNLWPMLYALDEAAWPAGERWDGRYLETARGDYSDQVIGLDPHTEPEFRTALLGQHRRVAKADVLEQLPPKVYSVREVDLPAEYRKAYDAMERDMIAELPATLDGPGGELSVMSVLTQMTRLSQLASSAADVHTETVVRTHSRDWDQTPPQIIDAMAAAGIYGPWFAGQEYEREETTVTLKAPSWKVDALLEVLDERETGQPGGAQVVVFTPSRQLAVVGYDAVVKSGRRVGLIVGGQTAKARTENIDSFQAGKLDVVCATTGAGGVGVTLTAANTVVFLQRPWSLVEALQAEDRCHRIGSEIHDSIEIIDIVARNTIDSRVREVLRDKAGQLAALLQDPRIVTELLGGKNARALVGAS